MNSKEYKIYMSRWKIFTPLILSLCFVVLMIIFPFAKNKLDTFIYYLGLLLFGSGTILFIYYFFFTRPRIIISKTGIWDHTMKSGEVRWENIEAIQLLNILGEKFISITLSEDFLKNNNIKKRSATYKRLFGSSSHTISIGLIHIDEMFLGDFIIKMMEASDLEREQIFKNFKVEDPNDRLYITQFVFNSLLILLLVYISYYYFWVIWVVMIPTALASLEARWRVFNPAITKLCSYIAFFGIVYITVFSLGFFTLDTQLQGLGERIEIETNHFGTKNGRYPRNIDEISKNLDLNMIQKWQLETVTYKFDEKRKGHIQYLSPKGTLKEYDTFWNEWVKK